MKLRFKVDQAEAFRRGINAPTSIVTVEVDPQKLSQEDRNLLADRMDGIDVHPLFTVALRQFEVGADGKEKPPIRLPNPFKSTELIEALEPTLESLLEAVRENANPSDPESCQPIKGHAAARWWIEKKGLLRIDNVESFVKPEWWPYKLSDGVADADRFPQEVYRDKDEKVWALIHRTGFVLMTPNIKYSGTLDTPYTELEMRIG